jgi:hypothetical protein
LYEINPSPSTSIYLNTWKNLGLLSNTLFSICTSRFLNLLASSLSISYFDYSVVPNSPLRTTGGGLALTLVVKVVDNLLGSVSNTNGPTALMSVKP